MSPSTRFAERAAARVEVHVVTPSPAAGRVVRNLIAVVVGQASGATLGFIATIVIARYLGVQGYGEYAYVLAFVGVFQLVASAGLDLVLVRDLAVKVDGAARLVGAAKSLTWLLSLVTFSLIAGSTWLTGASSETRIATVLAALGVIAAIHAVVLGAVFRAFEAMEVNAAGATLHRLILLGSALVVARADLGLPGMCAAFAAAALGVWGFYLAVLTLRHFRARLRVDTRLWWALLAESLPLGIAAIARRLSSHVDVLILVAFGMTPAAGHFSAAYKPIEAFTLMSVTTAQVIFPLLSRAARTAAGPFEEVVDRALRLLVVLSLPLALGLAISADRVVALVYGPGFEASAAPLAVLSLALLVIFPTSLFPFVFTAKGVPRYYTISAVAAFGVNAAVDVILVPGLAQVGASIGTLSGEIVRFAVGSFFLRSISAGRLPLTLDWRPVVAAIAMAVFVYAVRHAVLPLFLLGTVAGVAIYAALLIILGVVTSEIAAIAEEIRRWRRRSPS